MAKKDLKKKEIPRIGENDLASIIIRDEEAKELKITKDEVKCVLNAYSDIILKSVHKNVRVALPNLGEFYFYPKKGNPEGEFTYRNFQTGEEFTEYRPKQPDYGLLNFDVYKSVQEDFKIKTGKKIIRGERV